VSREEFESLLRRLSPDPGSAWAKYEEVHRRLVKFFEWNRCAGAEDLADEVLDRVAAKPNAEIRNVASYTLGVARFVCLESQKKGLRESHIEDLAGGSEFLADSHDASQEIIDRLDHGSRLACLRCCLATLMAEDQHLIVQYYSADGEKQKHHRQRLAEKKGLSLNAIRVRTNRLRETLEQCTENCLTTRRKISGFRG
jgi:DNA-directed RNA polymerase specialized sigma24 family protein